MHFSEDDLRSALRRKDPGEAFTQKVMARLHRKEAAVSTPEKVTRFFPQIAWPLKLRALLAGVAVAVLALGAWLGVLHYRQVQEERAGAMAKQQAILALQITTNKLSHVFGRVNSSQTRTLNVRRERL